MIRSMVSRVLIILSLAFPGINGWTQIHTPFDPDLLEETLRTRNESFDFDRREAMIPMRDGVRLFTVVLIPRQKDPMPIMLTRTPYGASRQAPPGNGPRMESAMPPGDHIFAEAKYIRVFQDVRGKYRSEGQYVMNLPLRGPLNAAPADHSTDTYDTIEWLLKNVPESNGRVGMIGTSYDGFLVLMALVNPHPALKAAVAVNPMVDTWIGDDWFHNGAFRQAMMDFIYLQETSHSSTSDMGNGDDYDIYLKAGSAEDLGRAKGLDEVSFWKKILQHPAYDAFWQGQALDKILAGQPLKVPTMYVHSLWDQEDIYGAIAAYKATELKDQNNDMNFLVIGPWSHGRSNADGSQLGPLKFNEDTALYFRRMVLLPFLNERLKMEGSSKTPPVLAYETGIDTWRRYPAWPLSCESGCRQKMKPLYLQPGAHLGFDAPSADGAPYMEYISDPAQPVPYSKRPVLPVYAPGSSWQYWLVNDQRDLSARADVLSYQSNILTEPVELSGQPVVNLFASTSGTDSDFVVKLIDVYPDKPATTPELSGFHLMISGDILRGRYREDASHPSPIPAGTVQTYRWTLPATSHVFEPGHRIMVQIQSSWFPLYDRNPQTYVENIFLAKPADYRKATLRIFQTGAHASFIELPVTK